MATKQKPNGQASQSRKPGQSASAGKSSQAASARKPAQSGRTAQPARSGTVTPVQVEPPKPVRTAVLLMYAGAALTAIGIITDAMYVVFSNSLRASHPHATAAQLHATKVALIVSLVFTALVEIGLWVFMARANRSGLKWARIVAAAFFAIYTLYLALSLPHASAIADFVFSALIWLSGLGATIFLWQPESTGYFTGSAVSPSGRPGGSSA